MIRMTVVVFDHNERVLDFLDEDRLIIEPKEEYRGLKTCSLTYEITETDDVQLLFKLGNYLWVSHEYLDDCYYIMDTPLDQLYSSENQITIELEEALVELNYVPLISQTDITADNGLTRMSLLRYLEEETSNIFRTRYEKDPITNTIHKYLDFLNPLDSDKNWELNISYKLPVDGDFGTFDENGNPTTPDSPEDIDPNYTPPVVEDDDIYGPTYVPALNYDLGDVVLRITDENGNPFSYGGTELSWDDDSLQLTTADEPEVILQVKYQSNAIKVKVNGKSFTAIPENTAGNTIHNYGIVTINNTIDEVSNVNLPNNSRVQLLDSASGKVFYEQVVSPSAGNTHNDILDLTYNVENISFEVDETDTFTAISPILTNDASTDSLTRTQFNTLINNWINLEVHKGDLIPMIVQKIQNVGTLPGTSTPAGNYFSRPIKPQDQIDTQTPANSRYEYWRGTAYWNAPFDKNAGEMHIEDKTIADVEYLNVHTKIDESDDLGVRISPKMGPVETSDEDPYAIYNDVAMKLKDKRTPKVNISVDAANYLNGKFNDYNVNDKVYVKIPNFDKLVTAVVTKTTKNPHDITNTRVEMSNYTVNNKVSTTETYITGKDISVNYPGKAVVRVKLCDANGNGINGKLLTFQLSKSENGTEKCHSPLFSQ